MPPNSTSETTPTNHRAADTQRAYDLQIEGGLKGALRYTIIGTCLCGIAHLTWPGFRRQTLALKGFLVSSASIFGLVIGADSHLLRYEADFRREQNVLRRRAINALAMEGKVASETEIRAWRAQHEGQAQAQAEAAGARSEGGAFSKAGSGSGSGSGGVVDDGRPVGEQSEP